MNKLAVFVEGLTEQEFVASLVEKVGGRNRVCIEKHKASGGRRGTGRAYELVDKSPDSDQHYFILIVDCGADNRVVSDVRDQYHGLVASGYRSIIAVRDVYPVARDDITNLQRGLSRRLPTEPIQVVLTLAVMEVEAWFLAEHTHFQKIDPQLTLPRIVAELGLDPSAPAPAVEDLPLPSNDLRRIYQIVGLDYHKTKTEIQRTVQSLDYGLVCLELSGRVPSIAPLIMELDSFFSPP